MSSPITDPRERAMAENPVPAPAPAAPQEALKPFGQDYQYAETLQNPFPEVIFSSVPNPVPVDGGSGGIVDGDRATTAATATAHSTPRPGTAGSTKEFPAFREHVWVEPADPPWYKAISRRRWACIIICTVGITGALVAVLAAMGKFSGGRSAEPDTTTTTSTNTTPVTVTVSSPPDDKPSFSSHHPLTPVPSASADPSATTDPSATATVSASRTASSTNPSSTASPKIDCTPAQFLTRVTWIGTTPGAYRGDFAQASTAASCCQLCLHRPSGGCAGWLFNGSSTFTPCTQIVVTSSADGDDVDGKDEACPKGKAGATFFAKGEGGGTAGLGPCGGRVEVQE